MKKSYFRLAIISFAFSIYEWYRWSLAVSDLESAQCHEGFFDTCGAALKIHIGLFFLSFLLGAIMIAIVITINRRKVIHSNSKLSKSLFNNSLSSRNFSISSENHEE